MTAIDLLIDGTTKAVLLNLTEKHRIAKDAIDCAKVAEVTKAALKAGVGKVMAEWKEATEARVGEGWLRELLNAQCNEIALVAVEQYLS